MPRILLRIKWDNSTEFVTINPDDKSVSESYINTAEYWNEECETINYTAYCSKLVKKDSVISICLEYRENENSALKNLIENWGKSEITIDLASNKAKARWLDHEGRKEYSGPAKSCALLEDSLLDEMSYESISRIKRPKQSAIRGLLLQVYGKCALSEEATSAVLDAAHIVEAGNNGSYSLKNCLLLRTDLHRLFDRGYLKFSPSGEAILSQEVQGNYIAEIAGKRLSPEVMKNVQEALLTRQGSNAGG